MRLRPAVMKSLESGVARLPSLEKGLAEIPAKPSKIRVGE